MTVTYLTRAQWGAGPLGAGHRVPLDQIAGLVAHHTVALLTDYDRDGYLYGDHDDIKRYMRWLQKARPDLGPEVPYSFVVFEGARAGDCVVAEGRGLGVTGAHTVGLNSTRYGVAVAGNTTTRAVTPGMLEGYRFVGRKLTAPTIHPTIGHRDTKATECPGNTLYALLPRIQPPFKAPPQEDDMTIDELIEALEGKGPDRRLRDVFKGLVQGAGLDALRPHEKKDDERGAWRGQIEDVVREVLDESPDASPSP